MRATRRWEDLWKAAVSGIDGREMESSGLVKHSAEMCWLARKNIELSVSGREDSGYFSGVAHESLDPLHALIKELHRKA